ncbi:helix-turn-helix domain-containing protein [Ureibacillus galli]|uniref:helix-turn-helix domain-containing protein n=1 Tax=Ureibacillus galli TaxID=2762222 RepID=UPI00177AF8AE|nr:helix-turn-helix domain-containing protein [Ureibacillus galli]
MKEYSVKDVAKLFGKHEETIKRWLRSGEFPNAYIRSDKEGWKIPEEDLMISNLWGSKIPLTLLPNKQIKQITYDEKELINLAYQAVTLTVPTNEVLQILTSIGIKRTLEILLILQQSYKKMKNPEGLIRMAIRENWNPSTMAVKMPKIQENI